MSAELPPVLQTIIHDAGSQALRWQVSPALEIIGIKLLAQNVQTSDILPFLTTEYQSRCNRLSISDKRFELAMTGLLVSHIDQLMRIAQGRPQISKTTSGKPILIGSNSQSISWSRSSPWLTIGLAASGDLGIDVEVRRPIDSEAILPTICGEAERAAFQTIAPSAQAKRFFAIWTLKEAILKAIGSGFQKSAKKIVIPEPAFTATLEAPIVLKCFGRSFALSLIEQQETTIAVAHSFD